MNLTASWGYIPVFFGLLVICIVFCRAYRQQNRKQAREKELEATQQTVGVMLQELNGVAANLVDQIEKANGDLQYLLGEVEKEKAELYQLITRSEQYAVSQKYSECQMVAGDEAVPYKYADVFQLAAQGLDSVEIARRAHMGRGEVELVLNLHSRHRRR